MVPIISIEVMKTIHERELEKNKRKTNKSKKEQGEQKIS